MFSPLLIIVISHDTTPVLTITPFLARSQLLLRRQREAFIKEDATTKVSDNTVGKGNLPQNALKVLIIRQSAVHRRPAAAGRPRVFGLLLSRWPGDERRRVDGDGGSVSCRLRLFSAV